MTFAQALHPALSAVLLLSSVAANAQDPAAPAAASAPVPPADSPLCANYAEVMRQLQFPRAAFAAGMERADFAVQFSLSEKGEIENIVPIGEAHPAFVEVAVDAVRRLQCRSVGRRVTVRAPFRFRLE